MLLIGDTLHFGEWVYGKFGLGDVCICHFFGKTSEDID